MILIADGGSTSCDWICLKSDSKEIFKRLTTPGLNPVYTSESDIYKLLNDSEELSELKDQIESIYFYGAGCNSDLFENQLSTIFKAYFPKLEKCIINGDIQGAVYASTQKPAVVGILGTGSNICFYDGIEIHTALESMGYSIMDDGAGSALGRMLLRTYYYKQLPENLNKALLDTYNLDADFVKNNIYHQPFPGRFMASYARFVFDHLDEPCMEKILMTNLNNYFHTHVMRFETELKSYPLYLVGSIAHFGKKQIEQLCEKYNITLGGIIKSPIEPLAMNISHLQKMQVKTT